MLHPPLFFVLFSFALQVRQSVKFVAAFKNQISYFFFFFKVMRSNIGVLTKKNWVLEVFGIHILEIVNFWIQQCLNRLFESN